MDVTLFHYQRYSYEESDRIIERLISEVRRFHGVFTVLWHNSFFDEDIYPGITRYYEDLMSNLGNRISKSLTGPQIIDRIIKLAGG